MMDTFFTPVYLPPTQDELKLQKPKNHHHYPNDQPERHQHAHPAYHSQDDESHSYANLDVNDENPDDCQARHHQNHHHRRHRQAYTLDENLPQDYHQPRHPQHHQQPPQQSTMLNPQQTTVTLSRASLSSISSSSSSSSLFSSHSWNTEGGATAGDPFSTHPAQQPQHSLSCSNILEVRTGFRQDGGNEPIVFATVKRGAPEAYDHTQGHSRQAKPKHASPLSRGQSLSHEGLLQTSEDEAVAGRQRQAARPHQGTLYKTASLGRSLAFSEENLVLGASGRSRRGMSTNQIPGKGILKNREPRSDIRKVRSMEVLSPRVADGQGKVKGSTAAGVQTARENFVQGKLQFSAFLDEITKQVISPSNLNILGVNQVKSLGDAPDPVRGPGPAKPQLPAKKHRESCSGEERGQHHKPPATQGKRESPRSSPSYHAPHSAQSDHDKLTAYVARGHKGSPHVHHPPQTSSHHPHKGRNRKGAKSPVIGDHKARESDRWGSHLTDGTITSPEPIQPEPRNHHKHRNTSPRSPPPAHPQHFPHYPPRHGYTSPGHQGEGQGHGTHKVKGSAVSPESASGSCRSDPSRTRDTAFSSNSEFSDQSVRHRSHSALRSPTDPHQKILLGGSDQFQALQDENTDLHQNLLQTVVCIESLEAELNRTREELSHVKDKYKSLLEASSGTKLTHSRPEENMHAASESVSSERKCLINRIAELSSELEEAHRTIAALETINVPCLIKDLMEKHFVSTEAVQKFLKTATTVNHPKIPSPPDLSQSGATNVLEVPYDWLTESEAGPHRVTAFIPWKQEASAATASAATASADGGLSGEAGGSQSQPFSIADISAVIYSKIVSEIASNHRCFQQKSPQGCAKGTNHTSPAGPTAHVRQGQETAELGPEEEDVTYLSAQQVLDEFINQLLPQDKASDGKGLQPHMSTSYEQE